jgi:hypothetical protein
MPTSKQYPYTKIEPQYDFRLLHLLPARSRHDRIRCRLMCSSRRTVPFEALSYTWGDPSETLSIEIDSHPVPVRRNLGIALRHLRTLETERILWVDALCINQTDSNEKGWQVPRMHEIYSDADRVIVWLGEATELSDFAINLIQNAAAVHRNEDGVELNEAFKPGNVIEKSEEVRATRLSVEDARRSIAMLFQRAWWSRVWVIQEVAFSRSCTVLCGSSQLDWQDFVDSFDLVTPVLRKTNTYGTSMSLMSMPFIVRQIEEFQCIAQQRGSSSSNAPPAYEKRLLQLLIAFRDLEATDPRDHVYAGLSMLYPFGSMGIFPVLNLEHEPGLPGLWKANYDKSAAQIFASTGFFIYLMMGDLKFLNLVDTLSDEKDDPSVFTEISKPTTADFAHLHMIHDSEGRTSFRLRTSSEQRTDSDDASFLKWADGYKSVVIPRLPSWAPNWAQRRLRFPVPGDYEMPETESMVPYRASGSLKPVATFVGINQDNLYELRTKGQHLGIISVVGSDFYGRDLTIMAEEAACITGSMDELLFPLRQSCHEALLRTLSGDRNADGTLLQDVGGDKFLSSARRFVRGRKFIIVSGLIGLGPRASRVGDDVYIIPGCHVPIVLRKKVLYGADPACSRHTNTSNFAGLGCSVNTCRRLISEWHQVIGGACKYLSRSCLTYLKLSVLKTSMVSWMGRPRISSENTLRDLNSCNFDELNEGVEFRATAENSHSIFLLEMVVQT